MNSHSVRVTAIKQRDYQAQQQRLHLIDTALSLFAEQGWERVSIPTLAHAAGVSQGLMYHYFRNKEALLFAVIERHGFLPEMRQLFAVAADRPVAVVLPELATAFHGLLQQRHELVQIVMREAPTNPDIAQQLAQIIQEGVALVAHYLDARITVGELRPCDTLVIARALLYIVVMLHLTHVPAEIFLSTYITALLHGITA